MNMNRETLIEKVDVYQYYVLGAMLMGGIAGTVAGSRMIQSMFVSVSVGSSSTGTVPSGISVMILSSVCFGLSAGYLLRDIQRGVWGKNP
jgi:hypothetical protein